MSLLLPVEQSSIPEENLDFRPEQEEDQDLEEYNDKNINDIINDEQAPIKALVTKLKLINTPIQELIAKELESRKLA